MGPNGTKHGGGHGDGTVGLAKRLVPLLDDLDGRKRAVITQRYGLNGESRKTLQAIGDELGRTRERVRQIQNMGLAMLQKMLENG